MNTLSHSQKFLQRRRFFTILPLLLMPFITVLFWLMNGKTGNATVTASGLNLQLPDAVLKKEAPVTKMSFYEAAETDSAKKELERKDDPYLNALKDTEIILHPNKPANDKMKVRDVQKYTRPAEAEQRPIASKEKDPELEQLSQMLDKIKEIQHPEAKKTIAKTSFNNEAVENDNTFFGKHEPSQKRLFYSEANNTTSNTVTAVMEASQKLQPGSVVRMRLLSDMRLPNVVIPSGSLVFGITSLERERMKIIVPSVRKDNQLMSVSISVYDMDGLEGIYVPGSLSSDVVKQSASDGLQSLEVAGLDPSLKGQLLHTGIGAVKNLFTKKIKQVSVTVPAGYRVMLHDEEKENE
ncbi:MAG: conjugative transposon TraM protein [Chitinophagaceae bacterium]|nr:conjugative transposon TraM protein [Chitinophagaceae bacterium]